MRSSSRMMLYGAAGGARPWAGLTTRSLRGAPSRCRVAAPARPTVANGGRERAAAAAAAAAAAEAAAAAVPVTTPVGRHAQHVAAGGAHPTTPAAQQLLSRWQELQDARPPEDKAAARTHPEALALVERAVQGAASVPELEAIVGAFGGRLLHHGTTAAVVRLAALAREAEAAEAGAGAAGGSSDSASGGNGSGAVRKGASVERRRRWRLQASLVELLTPHVPRLSALQVGLLLRALPQLRCADGALLRRLQARARQVMPTATEAHTLSAMVSGAARAASTQAARRARLSERAQPGETQQRRGAGKAAVGQQSGSVQDQQRQQQQQPALAAPAPWGGAPHAAPARLPPAFADAWLEQSRPRLAAFEPAHLAASAHALAVAGHAPPADWAEAFLEASRLALLRTAAAEAPAGGDAGHGRGPAQFSPSDLSRLLWSLARLGVRPSEAWFGAFAGACRGAYWTMPGPAVASLLWAAARLGMPADEAWLRDMRWQAQRTAKAMAPRQLAAVAWALAALRARPPQAWFRRYYDALLRRVGEADASSLATAVAALSRLRARPGRPRLAAVARAMHPLLPRFAPRDFAAALSGFAGLSYVPHADWLFDCLLELRASLPRHSLRDVVAALRALAALKARAAGARPGASAAAPPPDDLVSAMLARARVCLQAAEATAAGAGADADAARELAVEALVGVAQLGAPPGVALLSAALSCVLGVPYARPGAPPATAAPGASPPQHQHQQQQHQPVLLPPVLHAGSARRPTTPAGGGSAAAAANQPEQHEAQPSAISDAAAAWLAARPREAARLQLALSVFWRAGGDECAWLRRNAHAVDAIAAAAGASLGAAEPGALVQLVQALAAMRRDPGPEWLRRHEARVLEPATLGRLRPAALQGLERWYADLGWRAAPELAEAAARGAEAEAAEQRAEARQLAAQEARREAQRRRAWQVRATAAAGQQQGLAAARRQRQSGGSSGTKKAGATIAERQQQLQPQRPPSSSSGT